MLWPRGYEAFLCSTQLSMKSKLHVLINIKIAKSMNFFGLNHRSQSFILLINVKTIVGILTFMSRINFMPSRIFCASICIIELISYYQAHL